MKIGSYMKKYIKFLLVFIIGFICFLPFNSYALSKDYEDVLADIVNVKKEDDKVNIYLFYG